MPQLPRRMKPHPFRNLSSEPGVRRLTWRDTDGIVQSAPVNKDALRLNLHSALISRQPTKYPHRPHYEGRYWFAGTQKHVWHESMFEYLALMWLDHQRDITAIAAQPMYLTFEDGNAHYPDFFALHADGSQVLYDVRPASRVNEAFALQSAQTQKICEEIGWGYEVFTGITMIQRFNLELIAGFRHPRYAPSHAISAQLNEFLRQPMPLIEATRLLDARGPAASMPYLYHLMWKRQILFDTTKPMNFDTLIWSN